MRNLARTATIRANGRSAGSAKNHCYDICFTSGEVRKTFICGVGDSHVVAVRMLTESLAW